MTDFEPTSPTLSRNNSLSTTSRPALSRPPTASTTNGEAGKSGLNSKRATATNGLEKGQCNVQVVVRCRPQNERERSEHLVASVIDGTEVHVNIGNAQKTGAMKSTSTKRTFTFDHVFNSQAEQADVYNTAVKPLVEEVLAGFNCTVFAYGQTGTGKTHTMEGDISNSSDVRTKQAGVIPRSVHTIFDDITSHSLDAVVKCSFMEIYNEDLTDLLAATPAENKLNGNSEEAVQEIRLMADNEKGVVVQGLEEVVVRSAHEVFHLLTKAHQRRRVAETLMNARSSRSHGVFTITVTVTESSDEGEDVVRIGKLHLVDLAGSECVGRSGAQGVRANEAGNINKSLLTLGRVINALVEKSGHVPYRESKLTRLLQESLGGRAKTVIIATISPASASLDETLSTLDYAYRAKNIKNKPQVNEKKSGKSYMRELQNEIVILKRELEAQRSKNGIILPAEMYESYVSSSRSNGILIAELEGKVKAKEEELAALELKHNATTQQLVETTTQRDTLTVKLHDTEETLQQTATQLRETENVLEGTRQTLSHTQLRLKSTQYTVDEQMYLVQEHQQTEAVLLQQAAKLKSTADTLLSDKNLLHQKVEHQSMIINTNEQATSAYESQTTQCVDEAANDLKQMTATEVTQCESQTDAVQQQHATLSASNQQLTAAMQASSKTMSSSITKVGQSVGQYANEAASSVTRDVQQHEQYHQQVQSALQQTQSVTEQHASAIRRQVDTASQQQNDAQQTTSTHVKDAMQLDATFEKQLTTNVNALHKTQAQHSNSQISAINTTKSAMETFLTQHQSQMEQQSAALLSAVQQLVENFKQQQVQMLQESMAELQQQLVQSVKTEQKHLAQYATAVEATNTSTQQWLAGKHSAVDATLQHIDATSAALQSQYATVNKEVADLQTAVSANIAQLDEQQRTQLAAVKSSANATAQQIQAFGASNAQTMQELASEHSKSVEQHSSALDNTTAIHFKSTNAIVAGIEAHVSTLQQHSARQLQLTTDVTDYVQRYVHTNLQHVKPTASTPTKRRFEYPTTFVATSEHQSLLHTFGEQNESRLEGEPHTEYEPVYAHPAAPRAKRQAISSLSNGVTSPALSERLSTASVASTASTTGTPAAAVAPPAQPSYDDSAEEDSENQAPSNAEPVNANRHTRSKSKVPEPSKAPPSRMRAPTSVSRPVN